MKNRLLVERNELQEKVTKLVKFIDSDDFTELDSEVSSLLICQIHIMRSYLSILDMRLELA